MGIKVNTTASVKREARTFGKTNSQFSWLMLSIMVAPTRPRDYLSS